MKTADIVVGEHYAYARGSRDRRHRVKVLESGVAIPGSYTKAKNGVVIQMDNPDLSSYGAIRTVLAAQIRGTWADQVVADQRQAERVAKRMAHEAEADAVRDEVISLLASKGFDVKTRDNWKGITAVTSTYNTDLHTPKLVFAGPDAERIIKILRWLDLP